MHKSPGASRKRKSSELGSKLAGEGEECRALQAPHREAIPAIQAERLDATQFWAEFVSRRRPVVIKGHPKDPEWRASQLWSLDYLRSKAGECVIKVEYRADKNGSYGQGRRIKMTFREFLDKVEAGNDTLYFTAQQTSVGADGFLELYGAPLTSVPNDFGLTPSLLPNLVPQQMNLWIGAAREGASSGLHHDFHDNLYILLRGVKKFRLYPPSLASQMYTNGAIHKIYPNGRIVYEGQGDVLADGSDAQDVALWREHQEACAALAAEEDAVGRKGSEKRLKMAEDRLEETLEHMLDGVAEDWPEGPGADCNSSDEGDEEEEGEEADILEDGTEPDSFSKVDLSLPYDRIREKFPQFPDQSSMLECEVHRGEMLFLPAGWFHDVTSVGDGESGWHMAFNYWFYPPDNLEPSRSGFSAPYASGYWPSVWKERAHQADGRQCGGHDVSTASLA
ncbi:unnamed protein product [Ostreobium quekettii]|uniref:JmjC domain-containing protein n=1 Tax=Ostreobium quekettii TaxID=121088 RepID=A0A8S1J898_9CHLO|nr:unnamed protein product [Ostreobium quekettii]|eukprot:evm.model.scf_63.14 EVM.evm.TU.scf_63.14   scf_63:99956-107211(+)